MRDDSAIYIIRVKFVSLTFFMNKKYLFSASLIGVLVLIGIVVLVTMSQPKNPGGIQSNPAVQNKNLNTPVAVLNLDEFGGLFATNEIKQETFYELTFPGEIEDQTRAAKLRRIEYQLQEQAQQGNNSAKTIFSELQAYKSETQKVETGLKKQECSQLINKLLPSAEAENLKAGKPLSEDTLKSIAQPDYIPDLWKRRETAMLKAAVFDNPEESCKTLSQNIVKIKQDLAQTPDLGPIPPKAETMANAALDATGQDPVSKKFYNAEASDINVKKKISGYTLDNTIQVSIPATTEVYELYHSLGFGDAEKLGRQLGMTGSADKPDFSSYLIQDENGARIEIAKNSGAFRYFAPGYFTLSTDIQNNTMSPTEKEELSRIAVGYLEQTKLQPLPGYLVSATYRQKNRNTLLVEIKRAESLDGTKTPVLKGLQLLQSNTLETDNIRKSDPSVYDTSDGFDGMARLNDANTITVEVDRASKTVLYIDYRMRRVKRSLGRFSLISSEEALKRLQQGKGIVQWINPVGSVEGSSRATLFPSGEAVSTRAKITDVRVGYLNRSVLLPQAYLSPAYFFQGEAVLTNGTVVNFLTVVSALSDADETSANP